MSEDKSNIQTEILSVLDLLKIDSLSIPDYQRPYKWNEKNVNQLIDDICYYNSMSKSAYRLGTIVIHHDNKYDLHNIVDGQQRTLTLALIARCIYVNLNNVLKEIIHRDDNIEDFMPVLIGNIKFSNEITKYNIIQNYKAIERRIADFDNSFISFFFKKCHLVRITLDNVSEAFQFFDSQNARGRDLDPHDLLKAFHLREMEGYSSKTEKRKIVSDWEAIDTNTLSKLFSQYLFRIRNWSKGRQGRYFTKNDVTIFKGLTPNLKSIFPYAKQNQIAHYYVENYNSSIHRDIHNNEMAYPFQIDQPVINGKRFFEMIVFYNNMISELKVSSKENEVVNMLYNYKGAYRVGDKYVKNLFYCALLYYVDRFGYHEIDKVINKLFVWAYSLRLKLTNVRLDSVDNYALNRGHASIALFKKIREAINPSEIMNIRLEVLNDAASKRKIDEVIEKFKELKYYE